MTEDKNYGWRTRFEPDQQGKQWQVVEDLGKPPIVIRNITGAVTLEHEDADSLKVTALDFRGYPRSELPGGTSGKVKIDLLPDCLYYVIHK